MTTTSNQPNSEAEQAVLGSILLKGAIPPEATIEADDFGNMAHRDIFLAMTRIMDRGEPVDLIATMTELGDKLEQSGGASYLSSLTGIPISARNIGNYCKIVQNNADRRKLLGTLENAKSRVKSGMSSTAEIVAGIRGSLETVGGNDDLDPTKILEAFEVKQEYVKRLGKEKVIVSNLLIMQHILVIIAMSGGGKTAFTFRYVAPELARQGFTVWYCDADSPASEHKAMKEIADRHGFKFVNPDANEGTDVDGLKKAISKIADSNTDLSSWVFVFDTLKKFADLMQKNAVKQFFTLCRRLTAKGATVVLLAHANKYRGKDGNLIAEGVNDVRSDTDELIFFERTTNPNGGIDVTSVVDPERGAKVRGVFEPFSFHISEEREITFYQTPLPTIDRTLTSTPKATDDEIIETAKQYLFSRNEPVAQRQLVQHVSDLTGTGDKRVRQLITQHAEPKDALTMKGFPLVYSIGLKNAHYYEVVGK